MSPHKEKKLFSGGHKKPDGAIFGGERKNVFGKKSTSASANIFKKPARRQDGPNVRKKMHAETEVNANKQEKTADPIELLNDDQYAAAILPLGRSLVIASAGTGKTSTIMGRLSHILHGGMHPSEILLLTFTSKAASEMTERIEKYFGHAAAAGLATGTFHSICLKLVKKLRPDSTLRMPKDAALLFKSLFEHRRIVSQEEGAAPYSASTVYEKYGLYINTTGRIRPFAEWFAEKHPEQSVYADVFDDICDEFEKLKLREKFYDFNDLLLISMEYYRKAPCPFKEIIVDEYQDTNILQSMLLDVMRPSSLYCVGDYDQSIYAFNGADIGIIGSYSTRYKSANVSTLFKNYRSSPSILAVAEKVIKFNPRLYPKCLEVMVKEDPMAPQMRQPGNPEQQNYNVADNIMEDCDWGSTAVIYRSNASGDGIEAVLKEFEIPYVRKGEKSFFESKDMLAFISLYKIIAGDSSLPSFLQMAESSSISAGTSKLLHHALSVFGSGCIVGGLLNPNVAKKNEAMPRVTENTQMGIFNAIRDESRAHLSHIKGEIGNIKHPIFEYSSIKPNDAKFLSSLDDLFRDTKGIHSPQDLVRKIGDSGALKSIWTNLASLYSRDRSGAVIESQLKANIGKMYAKIEVMKRIAAKKKSHKIFLSSIASQKDGESDPNSVQLLSAHASKGLEFNNVHLIDLVDGTFPNTKLMNNGGGGIEEERRLFYVAVTRAKRRLYCYAPTLDKRNKPTAPSQFLYEGDLLKK